MKLTKKQIIAIVISIAIGALCFYLGFYYMSDIENFKASIEILDKNVSNVLGLTAGCAALSVALALIPGDATTPIASKVADLTTGLLLVLCVVFVEKYLLTVAGTVGLGIIIPIACLLFILYVIFNNDALRNIAIKLCIFGLAVALVIPGAVKITDVIDKTFNATGKIEETITDTDGDFNIIETVETTENISDIDENEITDVDNQKKPSFFDKLKESVGNAVSSISDKVSSVTSTITTTISVDNIKAQFQTLVEGLAVMIVTSCLIPLVVVFLVIKLVKLLFNVEIKSEKLDKMFLTKNKTAQLPKKSIVVEAEELEETEDPKEETEQQ